MNKEDKALGLPRNEPPVPCYVCEKDMTERSMNLCCQDCCDRMTELPSKEQWNEAEKEDAEKDVHVAELEKELASLIKTGDAVAKRLSSYVCMADGSEVEEIKAWCKAAEGRKGEMKMGETDVYYNDLPQGV